MRFMRQSTTATVQVGPFLDKTDGVTEETALTVVVEVSKNGAAFAARNSATAITHDAEGWYRVELDATDTNTLGALLVKAHDSTNHLPVWHEIMVLPAVVYDSLVAGSDTLTVDLTQINGIAVSGSFLSQQNVRDALKLAPTAGAPATDSVDEHLDTIVAQTDKLTFDGANHIVADARKISTSATAADNVEANIANLDATVSSRLASTAVPTNFADLAITASTGKVTVGTNDDKTGYTLSTAGEQSAADTILARDIVNVNSTFAQFSLAAGVMSRLKWSVSGTIWTVKKTDATTAYTYTISTTAGNPITSVS